MRRRASVLRCVWVCGWDTETFYNIASYSFLRLGFSTSVPSIIGYNKVYDHVNYIILYVCRVLSG